MSGSYLEAGVPRKCAWRRSFIVADLPGTCPEELAGQGEPGREPGAAAACVPAAGPGLGNAAFPGELAALCAAPAAPGPAGAWGRGEQVFVITEQLGPEHRERRRPPVPLDSGQGRPLAHASRVRFCPGAFLNKQDVSAAKTSSSDAEEEEGRSGVRASDPGGRDSPALCHRHLPWPRAHPFALLCKVGSTYLVYLWEVECLIPRMAGM